MRQKLIPAAQRLQQLKPITKKKIEKAPKCPEVRRILSLVSIVIIPVVTPVVSLLSYRVPHREPCLSRSWFLSCCSRMFCLPLFYTGIVCDIYLLMSKKVRILFTTSLLLVYLFATTFDAGSLYPIELFRSFTIIRLLISVNFPAMYSAAEPIEKSGSQEVWQGSSVS